PARHHLYGLRCPLRTPQGPCRRRPSSRCRRPDRQAHRTDYGRRRGEDPMTTTALRATCRGLTAEGERRAGAALDRDPESFQICTRHALEVLWPVDDRRKAARMNETDIGSCVLLGAVVLQVAVGPAPVLHDLPGGGRARRPSLPPPGRSPSPCPAAFTDEPRTATGFGRRSITFAAARRLWGGLRGR